MDSIVGKHSKSEVTKINEVADLAADRQAVADAAEAFATIANGTANQPGNGGRPRLTLRRRVATGNAPPPLPPVSASAASAGAAGATATPLKRLTGGRRELAIAHAGETYLLRVTKANKLILTKASAVPADAPA